MPAMPSTVWRPDRSYSSTTTPRARSSATTASMSATSQPICVWVPDGAPAEPGVGPVLHGDDPGDAEAVEMGGDRSGVVDVEVQDHPLGLCRPLGHVAASVDEHRDTPEPEEPVGVRASTERLLAPAAQSIHIRAGEQHAPVGRRRHDCPSSSTSNQLT